MKLSWGLIGTGSPSRDAANWLPSRCSLSVETRRRYGWLRMVCPGARLLRAPIWCPSGGVEARERQGALSRRAWLRPIGSVHTRFGDGGEQLDRRRARGVLNTCARESKTRTGTFLRKKLISNHGLFSSYEGLQRAANGQDTWGFSGMHRTLDGWMLACGAGFISSRPPPPWTSVFQFSLFLYVVWP